MQISLADSCGDMPLIDQLKDNAAKWKADFQQLDKEGKLVTKLATMNKPIVVRSDLRSICLDDRLLTDNFLVVRVGHRHVRPWTHKRRASSPHQSCKAHLHD